MRKILAGVLGVAGLVAVVLVASAGPASAQTVQKFITDGDPGTYTVSWSTNGGCDPSKPGDGRTLATDGASGSVSRTVAVPANTLPTASVTAGSRVENGTTAQMSVSTGSHCNYSWTATFVSSLGGSKGIACTIRGDNSSANRNGTIDVTNAGTDVTLTVEPGTGGDACTSMATIYVDVPRPKMKDDPDTTDVDESKKPDQPTSGAILHTTFSATATPVKDSNDECKAVTGETEVDDKGSTVDDDATNDDTVGAKLRVLDRVLSVQATNCDYDVVVDVPAGFKTTSANSNTDKVESYTDLEVTPTNAAPTSGGDAADLGATDCGETRYVDGDTGTGSTTAADNDDAVTVSCRYNYADVSASVAVAVRQVFILQNVVGDAGGANATYSLTEDKDCGIPADLPKGLTPSKSGGIQEIKATVAVELREGFFNISGAVMNPESPSDPATRIALNEEADACVVKAAVSGLPGHCAADAADISADLASGVDAKGRAIVRFDITCAQPEPEAPADDGGDMMDDGDGGDMTDGDDGGDMMDDGGDAGPPMDAATG